MGTDEGREKKKKPFYRNVEDTLEDVGITRRQLGYWRKQGLFKPQLGLSAKNFTEGDTAQLRFLKRLIDDLGLPVSTVKQLIMSTREDGYGGPHSLTYIDIETPKLMSSADAMNQLIADAIAGGTHVNKERWFLALSLQIFRDMCWKSVNEEVYQAQKKALYARLERVDRLARLRQSKDGTYRFVPRLETDPDPTSELAQKLVEEREGLESEIEDAIDRHPPF